MPTNIPGVPKFFIKVNGQRLKDSLDWQISRIMIDDQIDLPSMFSLELDSDGDEDAVWLNDKKIFNIGDEIRIEFKSTDTPVTAIIGEVTFLEIEYSAGNPPRLQVRGYDVRHRLQRGHKIRSFLKNKDSDIAKQIAKDAGLQARVTDSKVVHEYIVQANQTDFAFLQERGRLINYEMVVRDKQLLFRPVANNESIAIKLSTESDLTEFRVQLSATGQVDQASILGWDVKKKQVIAGKSSPCPPMGGGSIGGKLGSKAFGAAKIQLAKQPVMSQSEANQLATAALAANALSFIQGEGSCSGRLDLKAGITVEVLGIGKRFSGPYYVTKVNHMFDTNGFSTNFTAWRNAL